MRALWAAGFLVLFVAPMLSNLPENGLGRKLGSFGDFLGEHLGYGSNLHFHPAVTIPYFITSVGWGSAIGVALGLRPRKRPAIAYLILFLTIPAAEWLILQVFFPGADQYSGLYKPWQFLYFMLMFYSLSCGAFWMALKWRLIKYLSDRPIAAP